MNLEDKLTCPACGGSGGGPLGRAGSVWDTEDYVCPRCKGSGVVPLEVGKVRPGVAKAPPAPAVMTGSAEVGERKTGRGQA